jgi:hypothetical protein
MRVVEDGAKELDKGARVDIGWDGAKELDKGVRVDIGWGGGKELKGARADIGWARADVGVGVNESLLFERGAKDSGGGADTRTGAPLSRNASGEAKTYGRSTGGVAEKVSLIAVMSSIGVGGFMSDPQPGQTW